MKFRKNRVQREKPVKSGAKLSKLFKIKYNSQNCVKLVQKITNLLKTVNKRVKLRKKKAKMQLPEVPLIILRPKKNLEDLSNGMKTFSRVEKQIETFSKAGKIKRNIF